MTNSNSKLKILHTSDWHLGRTLYGQKRHLEFEAFFNWLIEIIHQFEINVLLVAGDIFDTTTPDNRSQELYYRFLYRLGQIDCCRHAVITGGNHDSPSFMDAPQALLKTLNIQVVGALPPQIEDQVLVLKNSDGEPELIVAAVPYLRDRDIRSSSPGETIQDKQEKLATGIAAHYDAVITLAQKHQQELAKSGSTIKVPLIAMGHLFTRGGKTFDGDGVRNLYIGTLGQIGPEIFPAEIDYLALGHLHHAQTISSARTHFCYSGSPLMMNFGETRGSKSVNLVEINPDNEIEIETLPVPQFQELIQLKGDFQSLQQQVKDLKAANSQAWLEIIWTGQELGGDLRDRLQQLIESSPLKLLRIKNFRRTEQMLQSNTASELAETLKDLDHREVFERCLRQFEIPSRQWPELRAAYLEISRQLLEEDNLIL